MHVSFYGVVRIFELPLRAQFQKRHKSDDATNARPTIVLQGGQWVAVPWKQARVGHIVRVEKGQEFPADMIILATSEEEGLAYVETSNLDGYATVQGAEVAHLAFGLV